MTGEELKQFLATVPKGVAACTATGCGAASECLHHLYGEAAPEGDGVSYLVFTRNAVSPSAGRSCPHFASSTKVRMAWGISRVLGEVKSREVRAIAAEIIKLYSSTTYYRIRNGKVKLSPRDQELLSDILVRHGATPPIVFDRYEDCYDWNSDIVSTDA